MSVRIQFSAIRSNSRFGILNANAADALHMFTLGYMNKLAANLREYPPAVPNSTYRRTGRLGAAWKVEEVSHGVGIHYILSNSVQDHWNRYYSAGVQGGMSQQWSVHRGRWHTVDDVMRTQGDRDYFRRETQNIITRLIGRAQRVRGR